MGPRETLSLSLFQLIRGSGKFRPAASFKTKALSQFSSRLSSASACSSFRVVGTQRTRDWSLSWYQRKDEQGSNKVRIRITTAALDRKLERFRAVICLGKGEGWEDVLLPDSDPLANPPLLVFWGSKM